MLRLGGDFGALRGFRGRGRGLGSRLLVLRAWCARLVGVSVMDLYDGLHS